MSYEGIFIRDQLGQQPDTPSSAWSTCPDIILHGKTVEPDLSKFTSAGGYATDFGADVYVNQNNYVYLRGINTNSTEQKSHMYYYYTESDLMLWPKNWRSDHITVADEERNWSMLDAAVENDIAVTSQPLVWVPPTLSGSQWDHYCVIVWSDNNPTTPTPPDFESLNKFSSCDELATFVQQHPNMGWRNTHDIYGSPPQYTYSTGLSFQSGGGTINVSVSFIDIPDDGTFSVNLQGTDKTNTIAASGLSIGDYKGGYNVQALSYPGDFSTSLDVQWFKGKTAPSPAAQVKVSVTMEAGPLLVERMNDYGIETNDIRVELFKATYAVAEAPDFVYTPTPVVLLGRQTWNMKYGVNQPTS